MFDLKITAGTIVDGTGSDPFVGDVAITDGVIVAVRPGGGSRPRRPRPSTPPASLVTPGFVDVHTHYDGQVTWDEVLDPSTGHGVTTARDRQLRRRLRAGAPGPARHWLIELMEGVEDIPGTALSEGMRWDWESFPEYLDALDRRRAGRRRRHPDRPRCGAGLCHG